MDLVMFSLGGLSDRSGLPDKHLERRQCKGVFPPGLQNKIDGLWVSVFQGLFSEYLLAAGARQNNQRNGLDRPRFTECPQNYELATIIGSVTQLQRPIQL